MLLCTLVLIHMLVLCSFVPPTLLSYLLTLVCTIPGVCLYTLGFICDPHACLVLIHLPCLIVPPALPLYLLVIVHLSLVLASDSFVTPVLASYLVGAVAIAIACTPLLDSGLCAPALCLSFSLWYLTCNRIVSFTVCFVLTFLF